MSRRPAWADLPDGVQRVLQLRRRRPWRQEQHDHADDRGEDAALGLLAFCIIVLDGLGAGAGRPSRRI